VNIRTVTILGCNGTMGKNVGAIFASFGDAKVYMMARTKEKAEDAVREAGKSVKAGAIVSNMVACDYTEIEKCVHESDLIFESVSENFETKLAVLEQVVHSMLSDAILATGTSGLSVTDLEESLSQNIRGRFLGLHFFNPPYSMSLCEVIPTKNTEESLLAEMCMYLEKVLYRTVVKVADAPAFLGNRIGFFCINEAMRYAERYRDSGGIGYIDAILGQFSGRSMAPLNTADFVGLDIHKAIVDNIFDHTSDFARESFKLPQYAKELVESGKLGRKSKAGLYKAEIRENGKRVYLTFDVSSGRYVEPVKYSFPFKEDMIRCLKIGDYNQAFRVLINNRSIEAEICLQFLLKYIFYSLYSVRCVKGSPHDADAVMAAGFNWAPPIAVIEALGGKDAVLSLAKERIPEFLPESLSFEELLADVHKSNYDYRRYFRAKS